MARKSDKTIKLCVICGDKAKGINFNALTCMSCKAFFRRNALRNKELKCPFNDSCQVDKITRKFCSRCRLQKCFDLGMKKEWILSDEEKRLIKEKILRNRLRRQQQEMKQQTGTTSRQRSKSYDSRTSSSGSSSSEQASSANGYSSGSFGNRRRHQNYKTAMTVGRATGQGFHQNDNLSSTTSSPSLSNGQANCPNLTPLGSNYSRYFSNAVSGTNGNGNSGLKSPTFSACDLFAEPSAFSLDILLTSDDWDQFSTSSSLNSFYSDCATTGNLHEIGNNGIGFLSKSSSSSLLTEDSLIFDIQSNGSGANYRHPCSALIDPKKDDFLYSTALSPYNPDLVQQQQHHQKQQHQQQCLHGHFIGSQQQNLLLPSGGGSGSNLNNAIDLFDPNTTETGDDNLDNLSQHLSSDSGSDLYDDPLIPLNVVGRNFKLENNNNNNNNDPCSNLVKILNNQPNSAGSYHSGTKSAFTALTSSPGAARDSIRDANNNNNNSGNRLFTKSLTNQKFDFSQYLLHDSDPFTFTGQQQQSQQQTQPQQQQDYFMNGSKTSSSLVPVTASQSSSQHQQSQGQSLPGASSSNQNTGYSFQHCGDYCYMIPYDNLLSIEQQQQQQQPQNNNNEDKSANGTGLGYLGQYLLKAEVGSFEEVISNFDPMIEMVPRLQMSMHNPELSKRELIQPERCLIKELTDACTILKNPYKRIIYIASEMSHNCSITEFSIHRLIRMSKRLSAFNRLVKPDQVELLKNGLIEMLGLRSVLMHDPDREAWNFLDDKCKITIVVNMQVIKSACVKNSFQQHRQYPKNFLSEWKSDNIIFDLMTAIVLFTPGPGLKEIDKVKEENLRYTYLLRRYLEIKYPTITEAKSTFNRLMSLLDENRTLSEDIVRFFISTNKSPIHASPLFAQILNCGKHGRCRTTSQTVSADSGGAASADSTINQVQMSSTIQQDKQQSYLSSAPSMGSASLTINTIDDDLLLKQMSSPTSSTSTRSCSSPLLPMSPGLGLFENCGAGVVNNNNCGPMSGFNNITSI